MTPHHITSHGHPSRLTDWMIHRMSLCVCVRVPVFICHSRGWLDGRSLDRSIQPHFFPSCQWLCSRLCPPRPVHLSLCFPLTTPVFVSRAGGASGDDTLEAAGALA
uniref:Uncharacterized protein n=1 Tax=Vitrella brassicaformis TaxID=1169539 RepID=A0A7S1P2Y7_9ALVE